MELKPDYFFYQLLYWLVFNGYLCLSTFELVGINFCTGWYLMVIYAYQLLYWLVFNGYLCLSTSVLVGI